MAAVPAPVPTRLVVWVRRRAAAALRAAYPGVAFVEAEREEGEEEEGAEPYRLAEAYLSARTARVAGALLLAGPLGDAAFNGRGPFWGAATPAAEAEARGELVAAEEEAGDGAPDAPTPAALEACFGEAGATRGSVRSHPGAVYGSGGAVLSYVRAMAAHMAAARRRRGARQAAVEAVGGCADPALVHNYLLHVLVPRGRADLRLAQPDPRVAPAVHVVSPRVPLHADTYGTVRAPLPHNATRHAIPTAVPYGNWTAASSAAFLDGSAVAAAAAALRAAPYAPALLLRLRAKPALAAALARLAPCGAAREFQDAWAQGGGGGRA